MHAPAETTQHRLSVLIPRSIYDELRRRADRESNSISSVARRIMSEGVASDTTADTEGHR